MMTKLPLDVHVLTKYKNNQKSLIFQTCERSEHHSLLDFKKYKKCGEIQITRITMIIILVILTRLFGLFLYTVCLVVKGGVTTMDNTQITAFQVASLNRNWLQFNDDDDDALSWIGFHYFKHEFSKKA